MCCPYGLGLELFFAGYDQHHGWEGRGEPAAEREINGAQLMVVVTWFHFTLLTHHVRVTLRTNTQP